MPISAVKCLKVLIWKISTVCVRKLGYLIQTSRTFSCTVSVNRIFISCFYVFVCSFVFLVFFIGGGDRIGGVFACT